MSINEKIMNITFRCDSSIEIGIGHVMRCLTLAHALKEYGIQCSFICREHKGNIINHIKEQGFVVHSLPLTPDSALHIQDSKLAHSHWLGTSQEQDAKECITLLDQKQKPDWLIIDHYALDAIWESALRPYCKKIMVLDDLADRNHDCELLLDQSLGREQRDYQHYLFPNAKLLLAPKYLLLRMPFADAALKSKQSRPRENIKNIFISMGGMDSHNYISQILPALIALHKKSPITANILISSSAPHIKELYSIQKKLPFCVSIYNNCSANDLVDLMLKADMAISASSFTSYELVCMYVPTLLFTLSEIQYKVAKELVTFAPVSIFEPQIENIQDRLIEEIYNMMGVLESDKCMENYSSKDTYIDGKGIQRVIQYLMG